MPEGESVGIIEGGRVGDGAGGDVGLDVGAGQSDVSTSEHLGMKAWQRTAPQHEYVPDSHSEHVPCKRSAA